MKPVRLKSYILYDSIYVKFYTRRGNRGRQWLPGDREFNAKKYDTCFGVVAILSASVIAIVAATVSICLKII